MATSPPRPAWLRNPIAKFFASLKLAVVLLSVLIIAAMAGTIYESSFDAKVARAYIYAAPWFNLWLVLLGANLTVSALSRWPWKKHHTAFLITHLGIITLLLGSLIGRIWGIEGTATLLKGEAPSNRLLVDEHQLRVRDIDGLTKGYSAEFLHHPPRPDRPRNLGVLASGARLSIVDYAEAIAGQLHPRPLREGGAAALHFTIKTAMMGQNLESWLLSDDPDHAAFSMGLAQIELKRGAAAPRPVIATGVSPASSGPQPSRLPLQTDQADPKQAIDLEEAIFAFSQAPDQQVGRPIKGGSSGAKARLEPPSPASKKGRLILSLGGKESSFDVAENLGRELPLENSSFTVRIEDYWPDFRIENNKPATITQQPNNPAVLITIRGQGIPVVAPQPDPHANPGALSATGGPPAMPAAGETAPNHLMLLIDEHERLTYELTSRKSGKRTGKLEPGTPIDTGWADWQLVVDQVMPHAESWMDFAPAKADHAGPVKELPDGVRVRITPLRGDPVEQWVPAGWQITVPTSPRPTMVSYGWKNLSLPIAFELLDFEVKRNEGNDSPAGFKSTVRVTTPDGETGTGQCWMNHPFNYPPQWWRAWTGLTFKMSQASWNPENLNQSTIQVLRDPGWSLKWIGSLLVVTGVFMMFYLRPYRKQTVGEPITPNPVTPMLSEPPREVVRT